MLLEMSIAKEGDWEEGVKQISSISKNVIDLVISKEPNVNKLKLKRISRFIDRMVALKSGNLKIRNEQDFEETYFEMEWVVNNI